MTDSLFSNAGKIAQNSKEMQRINFLIERDGLDAAKSWVRNTYKIYRRALLNRKHYANTPEYRPKFINSCLVFRYWLSENNS